MNYIRGALTASLQYYRDINPSTLTGAIDVIVVRRTNDSGEEELACSPFHVRFGKWQVLRPVDKKVKVFVNGEEIPYSMKVGDAGEAFFVFETDEDVPQDLITSPILQATQPGHKNQNVETGRFGSKEDGDENDEEQDGEPEPLDLDSPSRDVKKTPRPSSASLSQPSLDKTPQSHSPSPSPGPSNSSGVLNRVAGLGKAVVRAAVETERDKQERVKDEIEASKNAASHLYSETRLARTDRGDEALPHLEDGEGEPPNVVYSDDMVFDMEGYHTKRDSTESVSSKSMKRRELRDRSRTHDEDFDEGLATPRSGSPSRQTSPDRTPNTSRESSPAGRYAVSPRTPFKRTRQLQNLRAYSEPPEASPENSPPHYSWEWGGFPTPSHLKTSFNLGPERVEPLDLHRSVSVPPELEFDSEAVRPTTPTRSQTTAGALETERDGAYPSPPSTPTIPTTPTSMTSRDEVEKGELTADVNNGRRFLVTLGGRTYEFELSICEDLTGDEGEDRKKFKEGQVSFRRFIKYPGVVRDQNLVMRWNSKYITRNDHSLLMDSLSVWREGALAKPANASAFEEEEPLSSSDEREPDIEEQKPAAPKKGSSSWVRWWRSGHTEQPVASTSNNVIASSSSKTVTEARPRPMLAPSASEPSSNTKMTTIPRPLQTSKSFTADDISPNGKRYAKTLRLTSEQLKNLNLKSGPNSITFSLSASGVIACTARIFVWESSDKVVVSDIDGTITKSDALGHVFTMIGRDWTHIGVAKLYTDIVRNGYRIMYLTSRAIGQADSTRDYLKGINQNNYQLPEGPVIMSPDRLMASLHREVILRKPEVFKMACLRDIQSLFGNGRDPFYAGFGNRITDALSYRSVNIPSHRIFTIDSTGEVKMELLEVAGYKSSYIHLTDLVDQMFPPIHQDNAPEFTDFNYWKAPIQEFALPDLAPPSPALSARSDTSNQSTLARIRNFSLGRQSGKQMLPLPATQKSSDVSSARSIPLRQMTSLERLTHRFTKSMDTFEESSASTLVDSEDDKERDRQARKRLSMGSVPGSLDGGLDFDYDDEEEDDEDLEANEEDGNAAEIEDPEEAAEEGFDEDFAATGEMESVPFL